MRYPIMRGMPGNAPVPCIPPIEYLLEQHVSQDVLEPVIGQRALGFRTAG